MIPLVYTLRKGVRFKNLQESVVVISERPLNIIRASEKACQVLQHCNGSNMVKEIATRCSLTEEYAFKLCDYFNKRAILEVSPSPGNDYFPFVSVIIPTKNRKDELAECLDSVFAQDYPQDRMEVIVIDDGSSDGTGDLVHTRPCKLLTNRESLGQSFCRNLGAKEGRGEVLAFLDSDCVPDKTWLRELVSFFQWERIGAVGGYVDGYFESTALDRYEKVFSPLNLGKHIMLGTDNESTFYVPTCNLLVRKQAFVKTGEIRESMSVGEDVDFCWRLRKEGYDAIYVPRGSVKHKHRNQLGKMLKRRADYGTSEAILYGMHPDKKKTLQLPLLSVLNFLALVISLISLSLIPLPVATGCFLYEASRKIVHVRKINVSVQLSQVIVSVARSHFSLFYFASFHLVRYYMAMLICLGFFLPSIWSLLLLMLLVSSVTDYWIRRPQLSFHVFLFYYALDHLSYQLGVFGGCLRKRSFGSYAVRLMKKVMNQYVPG